MIWIVTIFSLIFLALLGEIFLLYRLFQRSTNLLNSSLLSFSESLSLSLREVTKENLKEFEKISGSFDSNLSTVEKIAINFAEGLEGLKDSFSSLKSLAKIYTSSPPLTFRLPLSGSFERMTPPIVIHLPLASHDKINPERKVSYD